MILTHIVQAYALSRHGSVLNLDLASVWPQCKSAIMKQTPDESAVGKPKTRILVEFYTQYWPCSNRRVQARS